MVSVDSDMWAVEDAPSTSSTATSSPTPDDWDPPALPASSETSASNTPTPPPLPGTAKPARPKLKATPASSTKTARSNIDAPGPLRPRVTKRRAARACVSCRARKVRCDVVENSPCGNCKWDGVPCIVQESRRRRKIFPDVTSSSALHLTGTSAPAGFKLDATAPITFPTSHLQPLASDGIATSPNSGDPNADANGPHIESSLEGHVPHQIYQRSGYRSDSVLPDKLRSTDDVSHRLLANLLSQASLPNILRDGESTCALVQPQLPSFVRPLPPRLALQDVAFLQAKGAFALPSVPVQNALLQAYVEFVHPYMPLLDLHEFLSAVNDRGVAGGRVSLLLYQAVMFAATAFVDSRHLRAAGFATRKAARKSFFQKTRLLYDFDYESDRLILVQALLLMTYWYESPDDQKDTWHWMGVAISLAHTIGLHRDPAATGMSPRKQRLWKRIWWSCFMRDRLIALGMRRPTRIKEEDFDVPMLSTDDFEIETLLEDGAPLSVDCNMIGDLDMQLKLAAMCVAKVKLSTRISDVLRAQYSVVARNKDEVDDTVNSKMVLLPSRNPDNLEDVNVIDSKLTEWELELPACCQYQPLTTHDMKNGQASVAVHRTLLHMVYFTTVSSLHRPQILPSSPSQSSSVSRQVQEASGSKVRNAAMRITEMAADLHRNRLEKFLPTTGVTVVLPAIIVHLLDLKSPVPQVREKALSGFQKCMRVMEQLRETYSAADYAVGFLEAALKKANIDVNLGTTAAPADVLRAPTPPAENVPYMTASEQTLHASIHSQPTVFTLPSATSLPALELSATSSAPTEQDTDSTIDGHSPPSPESILRDGIPYEFLSGEDFSLNAGMSEFELDQWLQYPPEGVGDDTVMGGPMAEEMTLCADGSNWPAKMDL